MDMYHVCLKTVLCAGMLLCIHRDLGSCRALTGYEIKIKSYSLQQKHCLFHQINKPSYRQHWLYCCTLCIRKAVCGQTSLTKAFININNLSSGMLWCITCLKKVSVLLKHQVTPVIEYREQPQ